MSELYGRGAFVFLKPTGIDEGLITSYYYSELYFSYLNKLIAERRP